MAGTAEGGVVRTGEFGTVLAVVFCCVLKAATATHKTLTLAASTLTNEL